MLLGIRPTVQARKAVLLGTSFPPVLPALFDAPGASGGFLLFDEAKVLLCRPTHGADDKSVGKFAFVDVRGPQRKKTVALVIGGGRERRDLEGETASQGHLEA